MLEEVSELIGLQVYTSKGIYLGNVNNLIIDLGTTKLDALFVTDTNPLLVEGSRSVSVPYRWIQAIGDVIILRYFPGRVSMRKETLAQPAKAET